ncbi:hypothetical protein R3P38DRAFT_3090460, partial [Favolaschia claudopus]
MARMPNAQWREFAFASPVVKGNAGESSKFTSQLQNIQWKAVNPQSNGTTPQNNPAKITRHRNSSNSEERSVEAPAVDPQKHLHPVTSFSKIASPAAKQVHQPLVWLPPYLSNYAPVPQTPHPLLLPPPPSHSQSAPQPPRLAFLGPSHPQPALPARSPPRPRHMTFSPASAFDPASKPIAYQTLPMLLTDLNCLLITPHDDRAFSFRGTYAFIGRAPTPVDINTKASPPFDTAPFLKTELMSVAWAILDQTVLAFDVQKLQVHVSGKAAAATIKTAAIWMGDGGASFRDNASVGMAKDEKQKQEGHPDCTCSSCEHLLTITVCLEERVYVTAARV